MDENTKPSTSTDTQSNTTPITDTPAGATDPGAASSLTSDSIDNASPAAPAVGTSDLPDAGLAEELTPTAGDAGSMPGSTASEFTPTPAPTEVAVNTDPDVPSITSEIPGTAPVADQSFPDATSGPAVDGPATTPGVAATPAAPPSVEGQPLNSQPSSGLSSADEAQPVGGVPATSPIPTHSADNKTIIVLGAVAVILIGAILFLFFK